MVQDYEGDTALVVSTRIATDVTSIAVMRWAGVEMNAIDEARRDTHHEYEKSACAKDETPKPSRLVESVIEQAA